MIRFALLVLSQDIGACLIRLRVPSTIASHAFMIHIIQPSKQTAKLHAREHATLIAPLTSLLDVIGVEGYDLNEDMTFSTLKNETRENIT